MVDGPDPAPEGVRRSLHVLLVEDDPDDALLTESMLRDIQSWDVKVTQCYDGRRAVDLISSGEYDVCLLDYVLPTLSGVEVLEALALAQVEVQSPVVMLTGAGSEDVAVTAMKGGVSDYLVKGKITRHRLEVAVSNAMTTASLRRQVAQQQEELWLLARTDQVTGLLNRRTIGRILVSEISRAQRYHHPLSVVMIDIDHFKKVNDTHGHIVGDDVLGGVSQELARCVREVDDIGRWGGEELLVVLPETPLDGAALVGERLRAAVEALRFDGVGGKFGVTISSGVAEWQDAEKDTRVLSRADAALYEAKSGGRNRVVVAPS